MQKFDTLRNAALNALVVAYPTHCVNILTWAISSETLTLGCRIEVLAAMARAAYDLSEIQRTHAEAHVLVQGSSGHVHLPGVNDDDNDDNDGSEEALRGGKTIIRRPIRLAKLKQRTRYFRNAFGDCAEAFFFPVLQTFMVSLQQLSEELAQKGEDLFSLHPSRTVVPVVDPGLAVLLPSQALLTLGSFVKCAVNTLCQRYVGGEEVCV